LLLSLDYKTGLNKQEQESILGGLARMVVPATMSPMIMKIGETYQLRLVLGNNLTPIKDMLKKAEFTGAEVISALLPIAINTHVFIDKKLGDGNIVGGDVGELFFVNGVWNTSLQSISPELTKKSKVAKTIDLVTPDNVAVFYKGKYGYKGKGFGVNVGYNLNKFTNTKARDGIGGRNK